MTEWTKEGVSRTRPMIVPPLTAVPFATAGSKLHFLFSGRAGTERPRLMNGPLRDSSIFSGRWIPSNTPPSRPGPRVTRSDSPVSTTGSPTQMPEVSS